MTAPNIKEIQKRYVDTKTNLLSIIKDTEDRVVTRRWCEGKYETDIFPFRGWLDEEYLNQPPSTLLSSPPEVIGYHSECGFDAKGELIIVRTHVGNDDDFDDDEDEEDEALAAALASEKQIQTTIVLSRTDTAVCSCYYFDRGDESEFENTFKYFEQYFENGRPTSGMVFESEKGYSVCEYHYDNNKLMRVEETFEQIKSDAPIDAQLASIEQKYGVSLPPLLSQLFRMGLNQYGQSQKEWRKTFVQRAFSNPPALMCTMDVEWMTADEILDWEPPDYWKSEHQFLPFAGNGAGDLWCLYLNWKTESHIPIVLVCHDEDLSEATARDIEQFIVIKLVESFSNISFYQLKNLKCKTIDEYRLHLIANIEAVEPLIPAWAPALKKLLDAAPVQTDDDDFSYLSQEALPEFLKPFTFEHSGESFTHMS